ncbi:hypothetical protein, partial [Ruminococcus sp.]|uniref:hypothetical protein n=1 Tax=Ruminococcus sp. TaxID=41978 RepID=UPI0038701868
PREPVRVRCGFAAVRQKSAPSKLRRTENEQDFVQVSVQKVQAGWRLPRLISRKLPKYCHFQQIRIPTVTLYQT